MSEVTTKKAGRNLIKTILIILVILLVYAITVQVTQINLDKALDPERQEGLVRILRQLADPDIVGIDKDTGSYILSETTKITIERIIETIFMALVASTIGTALAVPISFLGARNLMEDIVAPLASVMAAIVALPIGAFFGIYITNQLLRIPKQVSQNSIAGLPVVLGLIVSLLVTLAILWIVQRLRKQIPQDEQLSTFQRFASVVLLALSIMISLVGLGLVAYLGLEIGDWLRDTIQFFTFLGINFFGFIGDMVYVLSDILRLLLPAGVGLLAGVILASYAGRYSQEAVLGWPATPSRLLTAVLAILGAFVISYGIGAFWNWLYEFDSAQNSILVPAIVGGLTIGILGLTLMKRGTGTARLLIGLGLAAGSAFLILQVSEALNQMLNFDTVQGYMATPALITGMIAGIIGGVGKPNHPYGVGFGIYTVTRAILNFLRSIEPLIMGIVFVVWVSLGPFAGIMALTLHSIAALGKLFSEQVEGIDEGPVEAITATGASRLQMVIFAVIPQIVPPFTAFALYRWDINVRMSTIIGFVGGGGIGFVLSQNIAQLRYRQASVMMLSIAIVVATLDYASAKIRSRII